MAFHANRVSQRKTDRGLDEQKNHLATPFVNRPTDMQRLNKFTHCVLVGLFCATLLNMRVQQSSGQSPAPPDASAAPAGASNATECAEVFFNGILDGNQESVHKVTFCPTHLDRLAIRALVRFGGAAERFREKFVETYGADAWKRFNDDQHLPYKAGAAAGANGSISAMRRDQIPPLILEATANALENESYTSVPNAPHQLKLFRKQGRWFVRSETLLNETDPEALRNLTNFLGGMAVEIERFYHAIGRDGVTPDDIDFEFGVASLVSMGANQFQNIRHRFDVSTLPTPTPFESIGDVSLLPALDVVTERHYRQKGQVFANAFLGETPNAYVEQLAAELRELVDPAQIAALRDRVRQHCNASEELVTRIEGIDYQSERGFRVTGKIGKGEQESEIEMYEVDGQWIGLTVRSPRFAIDSRNLTARKQPLADRHEKFFSLVVNGDSKGAYQIFSGGAQPSGEDYEQFADSIPDHMEWDGNVPLTTRAAWSNGERVVRVYSFLRVKIDGEPHRIRSVSEHAFRRGKWEFLGFDSGAIDRQFILNDDTLAEKFFRALGSGDGQACYLQFSERSRSQIHASVLSAYCKKFHNEFGPLQSIDLSKYYSEAKFIGESTSD